MSVGVDRAGTTASPSKILVGIKILSFNHHSRKKFTRNDPTPLKNVEAPV